MITVATVGTGCQAEDRRTGVGVEEEVEEQESCGLLLSPDRKLCSRLLISPGFCRDELFPGSRLCEVIAV